MLICRPVSPRSAPEKIRWWISYLEEIRAKYQQDPAALATIERCLVQARGWL